MQLTERCWLSKEKPQAGKPRHPEAQSVKEVGSFFLKLMIRTYLENEQSLSAQRTSFRNGIVSSYKLRNRLKY